MGRDADERQRGDEMTDADTLTRAAELLEWDAADTDRPEVFHSTAARLREMADHISEQDSTIDRLSQAVRLAESCIPDMPTIQSDPVGSMQKVRDRMLRLEAELSELKPLPPGSMTLGSGQREAWAEVRRLRSRIAELEPLQEVVAQLEDEKRVLEQKRDRLRELLKMWMACRNTNNSGWIVAAGVDGPMALNKARRATAKELGLPDPEAGLVEITMDLSGRFAAEALKESSNG